MKTTISNDYAYEDVFVRQLMNFAQPGDVVLVMSVSGNSANLVKDVQWCKANQVYTIALTGAQDGHLAELADAVVTVADAHYGRVEDAHMLICHLICYTLMEGL